MIRMSSLVYFFHLQHMALLRNGEIFMMHMLLIDFYVNHATAILDHMDFNLYRTVFAGD